jgi:hypothetical protein
MNGENRRGKPSILRKYPRWIVIAVLIALGIVGIAYGLRAGIIGTLAFGKEHPEFRPVRALAAGVLLLWLGGVVAYLIWAIRRYTVNYGLSDEEWKLLRPEAYASEDERQEYVDRRMDMIRAHRELAGRSGGDDVQPAGVRAGDAAGEGEAPPLLEEPATNPYERDSFGLPPGTIRGVLALTAVVMFLLVEMVNLFDGSLEKAFAELVTGFQMVLAFYFGSRAVEVLQAREREGRDRAAAASPTAEQPSASAGSSEGRPLPQQASTAAGAAPATPGAVPAQPAPSEVPVLPARLREERVTSMVIPAAARGAAAMGGGGLGEEPLEERVLALTASFETGLGFPGCFGEVAGNFDGQGISFGALQWNIGTGSLQPILQHMREEHDPVVQKVLSAPARTSLYRMLDLPSRAEQLEWARSIQLTNVNSRGRTVWVVNNVWKDALRALGTSKEMIELQVAEVLNRYQIALANCAHYGLWSERAVALFFDINVQNGKVDVAGAGDRIRADIAEIDTKLQDGEKEVKKMLIVARRRAEVSRPDWRNDVLARKETIANGSGSVHERPYDLANDFALTLKPVPGLKAPALGVVA